MSYDEVIPLLGDFGRYNIIYLIAFLIQILYSHELLQVSETDLLPFMSSCYSLCLPQTGKCFPNRQSRP